MTFLSVVETAVNTLSYISFGGMILFALYCLFWEKESKTVDRVSEPVEKSVEKSQDETTESG